MLDRHQALLLLHEYTASDALRKHMYAVELAMRAMAGRYGADPEMWGVVGLLHDFDYERFPNPERMPEREHPSEGVRILAGQGLPEDAQQAILGHASYTGVPRTTPLAKALFAVDELCGFLVACALITPHRSLDEVEVAGVRKKMKRADFARNVSREDIVNGAAELGVELDPHIAVTLEALRGIRDELGL